MTDRKTREVVYTRKKEDADIKPFDFMVFVPKDDEDKNVVKGMFLFETIGTYGVKTIATNNIKGYFSEKYGLTMETRSISVRVFMENLLKNDKLSKVTLIKNKISPDSSDNMFLNKGREEITYIKPKLKDSWIKIFLEHLDGTADDDIFEINDTIYEDIKFTFCHAGRTKTVGLSDIDRFSLVEDIPSYICDGDGGIDSEKLVDYMKETAQSYMDKMVCHQVNMEG